MVKVVCGVVYRDWWWGWGGLMDVVYGLFFICVFVVVRLSCVFWDECLLGWLGFVVGRLLDVVVVRIGEFWIVVVVLIVMWVNVFIFLGGKESF